MKSFKSAVLGTAFSSLALFSAPATYAADADGSWTLSPSKKAGMVQFGLTYRYDDHGRSQHEFAWPVNALVGLDLATPGRHDVRFTITREAGRIDGEGFMNGGTGAGTYTFAPSPTFVTAMDKLGFGDIDRHKHFAMAVHDVTTDFARAMNAEKLSGLDSDKLLAFRIFDVNSQFIREMRAAGLPAKDADKLIAFRVHDVTPAIVRELRKIGLEVDEDHLIAFSVHEVTPEYVSKVEAMGLGHPDADQLIAMRVHDVTPEYIAEMKSRGLKNLTLDRIVQLKVHGID